MPSSFALKLAARSVLALAVLAACGGGSKDSTGPTGTATPVLTTLVVSFAPPAVAIGHTTTASVSGLDQNGAPISVGPVTWSSGLPGVASVSASGVVSGLAAGQVPIIATAGAKSGQLALLVVDATITGISNPLTFMNTCPQNDPAYATIRADFTILLDGQPDNVPIVCTEPYAAMPLAQLTDELIALQTLRTAYYVSIGTAGRLPWTTLSLYAWMKANVAGLDLVSAPGSLDCCAVINGKNYFQMSRQDAATRDTKRDWPDIASLLDFYAHEIRHADGGHPHVTGCAAFPHPTDPAGCDATYDLSNLGSYGVQYWMESNWALGLFYVGIGCLPQSSSLPFANLHVDGANIFSARIVSNPPPTLTARAPYGGQCMSP